MVRRVIRWVGIGVDFVVGSASGRSPCLLLPFVAEVANEVNRLDTASLAARPLGCSVENSAEMVKNGCFRAIFDEAAFALSERSPLPLLRP